MRPIMAENELTRQLMQRFEQLVGGFDELLSARYGTRIPTKGAVLKNWREVERIVRELARMTDISLIEHFPEFPQLDTTGIDRIATTGTDEVDGLSRKRGMRAPLQDARPFEKQHVSPE